MYGCESDYLYAIKCLFKDSPMLLIGIVFTSSILIFALSLRIAERDVPSVLATLSNMSQGSAKSVSNDISSFANALWLTIITMTTVGYGDFYPRTTFGRIIDVVLVVWGTFIVSLMVVVLTNTLNMDQSERRALIVLNRL
jgi:potassium intermediate/small conductance calcium-activated channel subfamily N protein 2